MALVCYAVPTLGKYGALAKFLHYHPNIYILYFNQVTILDCYGICQIIAEQFKSDAGLYGKAGHRSHKRAPGGFS